MNFDFIIEELKKRFKFINISDDKVVLSNSKYMNEEINPEFFCDESGCFTFYRVNTIQISDLGNTYMNLVGLNFALMTKYRISVDVNNKLKNAITSEEISNIFYNSFGEDYVKNNLFIFPTNLVNDAINLVMEDGKYVPNELVYLPKENVQSSRMLIVPFNI